MTIVFDTETTGKADFKAPYFHPIQPRIVQIAALLLDDGLSEVSSLNLIIRPFGFNIPDEAARVHGITDELARRRGVELRHALEIFLDLCQLTKTKVAFNEQFDRVVIGCELHRLQITSQAFNPEGTDRSFFCAMLAMKNHCKLPGNYGDYKWPKLQEAYEFCYGQKFDDAHDALADVRATASILRWLKNQERKEAA